MATGRGWAGEAGAGEARAGEAGEGLDNGRARERFVTDQAVEPDSEITNLKSSCFESQGEFPALVFLCEIPEAIGVLPPDFPYGKGGFEVSGGEGRGRVNIQMNPGPYRLLYACGGGTQGAVAKEPPLAGGSSSRPMVARLVR